MLYFFIKYFILDWYSFNLVAEYDNGVTIKVHKDLTKILKSIK